VASSSLSSSFAFWLKKSAGFCGWGGPGGLLFVAVSIAPHETVKAGAPVERQAVVGSAFTALLLSVYGLGIVRAWQLLGARRYGLLTGWVSLLSDPEELAPAESEGATQQAGD
jgi:hypothetical protein